jgi:hypothetical protein
MFKPCKVHDRLNNRTFDWKPEWAKAFPKCGEEFEQGRVIEWDGLLLDGWTETGAKMNAPGDTAIPVRGAKPTARRRTSLSSMSRI